ncbi:dimethylallyltransferase, partial [Pseudoalteromonas undina]
GQPPIDPNSQQAAAQTNETVRLFEDEAALEQLANTLQLSQVTADGFDAIFYPGGHGPLWDLSEDPLSIGLIQQFWEQDKPVAAVCHAPAVLVHAKTPAGKPLVAGRKVSAFTNSEEAAVGLTDVVPFLLEDKLQELGAHYQKVDDWKPLAVVDGNLITGQNPASSAAVARALLQQLKH